jgi:ethanolamine utilization microcompartment shell protein EutL
MKEMARPASAREIIEIVGPLDDGVVMRILETGVTQAEVLEAFTWANADDQIGTELERGPRSAVTRVYEILKLEEPEPDEPR